jgi:hypothetical protein
MSGAASAQSGLDQIDAWTAHTEIFLPEGMTYRIEEGPDFEVLYVDDRNIGLYIGNAPDVGFTRQEADEKGFAPDGQVLDTICVRRPIPFSSDCVVGISARSGWPHWLHIWYEARSGEEEARLLAAIAAIRPVPR